MATRRLATLRAPFAVRDFRLLWAAQISSELGDWAARLALSVLVYQRTGSAATTALVTACSVAPWVLGGPFLATLGDRYPRRQVMVVTDAVRAVLFATMIVPLPVGAVLALAFAAGLAAPPFEASRSAVLVDAFGTPDGDNSSDSGSSDSGSAGGDSAGGDSAGGGYGAALTVANITQQGSIVAGYLAGGGLVTAAGPGAALAANAATFAVSAVLAARLHAGRSRPAAGGRSRAQLRRAGVALWRDRLLRRGALLGAVSAVGGVGAESLVAPWADTQLGADAPVGLLAAAVPLATICAAAVRPHAGDHRRLLRAAAATIAAGAAVAAAGFATSPTALPGALVPWAGVGIVFAFVVSAQPVVAARLPTDMRASAFGLLASSMMAGQAAGAAGVGLTAAHLGLTATLSASMAALAVWAAAMAAQVPDPGDGRPAGVATLRR